MNNLERRTKKGTSLAQRLAAKLKPQGECLVFVGTKTDQGYGRLTVAGKSVGAHRVAWELINGPIPDELCVLHRCDNPSCCYVGHLFLGTVADNNADRAAKGRSKGTFSGGATHPATVNAGEKHWQAKLTSAEVASIRASRAAGKTNSSIAEKFGVHPATISRIARGVWRTEVSL